MRAALAHARERVWNSGTMCIIIAAAVYSVTAALVRPLSADIPVFEIVAFRSAASLGFSWAAHAAAAGPHGTSHTPAPLFGARASMPFLAARGLVGAAAMDCFYAAIRMLALAEAISLLFTNPAITALLAWALLEFRAGASHGL